MPLTLRLVSTIVIISFIATESAVIILLRLMEYFSQFYFGQVFSAQYIF